MYQARLENGDIINSLKLPATFKKEDAIICLHCGENLRLKKSRRGKLFFSHIRQGKQLGETAEHLAGKKILQAMCEKNGLIAQTEVPLVETQRRGDVYLPELQRVLELQCSPISNQELAMRTKSYQKEGIEVCWLFGMSYQLRNYLTPRIRKVLCYHDILGFYYFLLVDGLIKMNYHITQRGAKVIFKTKTLDATELKKLWAPQKLIEKKSLMYQITPNDRARQRAEIERGLIVHSEQLEFEQKFFYLCHLNLRNLPPFFETLLVHKLPYISGTGGILHYEVLRVLSGAPYTLAKLRQLWQEVFGTVEVLYDLPLVSRADYLESYLRHYLPIFRAVGLCTIVDDKITFNETYLAELFWGKSLKKQAGDSVSP